MTEYTHPFYEQTVRVLKACGGLYEFEDIVAAIEYGSMQSFERAETWVVTQVLSFPRRRVLEIVFVVGDMESLLLMEPDLVDFAKRVDCSLIMANGRMGWLRRKRDPDVIEQARHWKAMLCTFYREV